MQKKEKQKLTNQIINSLHPAPKRYRVWDTETPSFFVRINPTGTKTYYVKYRYKGLVREYKIGPAGTDLLSADLARKHAKSILGQVIDGADPHTERAKSRKQAAQDQLSTLGGFVKHKYRPWFEAHRKTGYETFRVMNTEFKHLLSKPLTSITPWDVQKWSTEVQKRKKPQKPATVNRRVGILKAILNKAVEWGVIEHNPIAKVKKISVDSKSRVRYLFEDEEVRLRSALQDRQGKQRKERVAYNKWLSERHKDIYPILNDRFTDYLAPMVLLTINTGLRRGELFNLRWGDITQNGRLLTVEGTTAKSGQTRHIPLNDEAASVLADWRGLQKSIKATDLIFSSPKTGEKLTEIKKSWGKLLDDASIANFRFHDLRHHFASKLVMAGVDLNTVRELLGHSDISTTLIYAHLGPEHKAAAVALLNT